MAEDRSAQSQETKSWPLPEFCFSVELGGVGKISFKEASGLDAEYDEIEYRAGDSPVFTKQKMPGLRKNGDITLKKGTFQGDKALWDWINSVQMNIIKREEVVIRLLNEKGEAVHTWRLTNAWPKKISVEGFKSDGNNVAMETLVLAHEGVTRS